jgi:hypothetical protein
MPRRLLRILFHPRYSFLWGYATAAFMPHLFAVHCALPADLGLCYSAAILYFALMMYIVLGVLNEVRPMWFFTLAFILFVLSQLDYYLLNKVICKVSPSLFDVDR